ncbi:WD40-repeat-containing domain protein [Boletus reticuloceps]|uniref:WD40-repeat-containing domain protein n=1 Tax=Boletus reticuloceps TaxID=495285 RepID=A0A8I3A860_9AGAM|nr:WD40-repeat-containing domain protein [Boletus reticuloceps]
MPNQQESKGSALFRFVCEQELDGQADSITSLAFSPAGDLFASGSEDCSVVIWVPLTGVMKHRILMQSAVTSLAWGPQCQLFIGCLDGTLFVAKHFKMDNNSVLTGTKSAITVVAVDSYSGHIGFGVGSELHMAKEIGHGRYATFSIFPSPDVLTNTPHELDTRVQAVALSFQDKGSRLTVAYLNHGVVCWNVKLSEALWQITPIHGHRLMWVSILSLVTLVITHQLKSGHAIVLPDKRIALSNLCDGTDLYNEGQSIHNSILRILQVLLIIMLFSSLHPLLVIGW